jgi:palmitoyl transferase
MNFRCFILIIALNLWTFCSWASLSHPKDFWQATKNRLYQIWTKGQGDLYLPFYAWHNRLTYDDEHLPLYNEFPWGAGFGKGIWDENGNWQGLYFMVFLDSHKNIEPMGGYGYLFTYHPTEDAGLGLGFTLMMTARAEYSHYAPFPGILPLASINYKNLMLLGAYVPFVPGQRNVGNIMFLMAKLTLGS